MTPLAEPPRRRNVRKIEVLEVLIERGCNLRGLAIHDLNLTSLAVDWTKFDIQDTLFLGCSFLPGVEETLKEGGAILLPRFAERPYDPYRACLYTPETLNEQIEWGGARGRRDEIIYNWYASAGKYLPDVGEALAQRVHDLSIDDALGDVIGETVEARLEKQIVGVMGGHGKTRSNEAYEQAARVALGLAHDHLIVTGGGPGIMEAANLGAYLSSHGEESLDKALEILRLAPDDQHPDYDRRAEEVRALYPDGRTNLSIPTWFYGFERSNLFATHIAKYFANSIREDGLLAISLSGIVFADGSAGTVQEIFMDAAQNQYWTFDYRSPMVLLGKQRWAPTSETGVFPTLRTEGREYDDLLLVSDSPDEAQQFIRDHPPTPKA